MCPPGNTSFANLNLPDLKTWGPALDIASRFCVGRQGARTDRHRLLQWRESPCFPLKKPKTGPDKMA